MNKKSLIEQQHEIMQKFFNDEPLNYYESLVVFAVCCSIAKYLLNKFAQMSVESEDDE